MSEISADIPAPGIMQQASLLQNLAGTIRALLEDSSIYLPPETMEGLEQLASSVRKLSRQLKTREEERQNLMALAHIGSVVNSSLELPQVLCIVMDTIVRLTGAERGVLMLREDEANPGSLVPSIARNWEQESIEASDFALSRTIIRRVVEGGQPVLTTNALEDPRFDTQDSVINNNLRSILCVPLKVKDEITGVIYADNRIRTGIFTKVELDLLIAFANQAAVAIENARLFESVKRTLAEVTELKSLMDNVFASIASGVITTDIDGKITLCNRATETILGCSSMEMMGCRLKDVFPSIANELSNRITEVRQSDRRLVGLEITKTLPKRGQVTLSLNLSPLQDAAHITQGVAIVVDDLTEKKQLEGQRRLFGRMVSPAVIEQLDPDQLKLGGRRTEITALFADVKGFTGFSENVNPELLVSILNRYLAVAADAVLAQDGTIDKFMGDAVMAWFNAPIPQADHALRAIRTALSIRAAVQDLHKELPTEFHLHFRTGIHCGEAVLGLIGSETRMDYTAIGDVVNTTKRIQEQAGTGHILVSADVYKQVGGIVDARLVSPLNVKGKRQPVEVYELLGL